MENKKSAIIISAVAVLLFIVVSSIFIYKSKNDTANQGNDSITINTSISDDLKNNRFDDALVKIDELLAEDPNNIDLLLAKAEVLLAKGSAQFKEEEYALKAQEIIKSVLEKDPENAEAYRLMGYSYEIQNMFDDALVNYNTALTFEETSNTYNWIGHIYELRGNMEVAEKFYEKAYQMDEGNRTVMRNLARIYMSTGRMDKAHKILEDIIEMPVDNISAVAGDYHSLGVIDFEEQEMDAAKANFEKALTIDPTFMLAQVELEKIKILFTDKKNDAIVNLTKISQNYPKQVFPVEWLGFAYLESDKMDEAIISFEKALEILPSDITLMPQQRTLIRSRLNYYLSIAYSLNEQTEESKDHLLRAMEGMNEATMTMITHSLQQGENGPYKNMMQDQDIVNLINQLNN